MLIGLYNALQPPTGNASAAQPATLSPLVGESAHISGWRRESPSPRALILAGLEIVLVLALLALIWTLFNKIVAAHIRFDGMDSRYFYDLAVRISHGEMPYRDFPFEYPPLAIVPIALPGLVLQPVSGHAVRYGWLLVAENVAFVVATAACLVVLARRGWSAVSTRGTLIGYGLLVAATPVLFWRFDQFATLLMMLGLVASALGPRMTSGFALGAGIAAKLFPIAIVPVLVAADLFRREWVKPLRLVVGAVLAVAIVGLVFWLGAGIRELSFFEYHADRGVQLESLLATIGMVSQLLGSPQGFVFNAYGAYQIQSPFLASVPWLGTAIAVVLVAALIVSTVARFRGDVTTWGEVVPDTLVTQLVATLLALMLMYRVFSPQYLVWVLPLIALRPRTEFLVVFVICLLTLAVYPLNYVALMRLEPSVMVVLIVRNLLMVGFVGWLLVRPMLGMVRSVSPRVAGALAGE